MVVFLTCTRLIFKINTLVEILCDDGLRKNYSYL